MGFPAVCFSLDELIGPLRSELRVVGVPWGLFHSPPEVKYACWGSREVFMFNIFDHGASWVQDSLP